MADPASLYSPCVECKKKRTLCIRVRRPDWYNFGHAALSLSEPLESGGTKTDHFGSWPAWGRQNRVVKNYSGDDPSKDPRWKPEDVRCREINEDQEKKLAQELAKHQSWDGIANNCSKWAGSTWTAVTGEALNSYWKPSSLLGSIK
jgi:hypothetical protein